MIHYEILGDIGFFFEIEILEKKRSKFQEIIIANSKSFGKVLILGNVHMAEKDEKMYHEPLAHFPLTMHDNPKKVLILGGGDGCLAREVLKHKSVEELVMVDIDREVVELSNKYFLDINKNPYADKRMQLIIDDAKNYVRETDKKFDVIFMDLPDPEGEAEKLYWDEIIKTYKRILNPGGILATHAQSPSYPECASQIMYVKMKRLFNNVHLYTNYIRSFGVLWGFLVMSDDVDFNDRDRVMRAKERVKELEDLKVVSPAFFDSAYYLPPWVIEKIKEFEKVPPEKLKLVSSSSQYGQREKF